MSKKRAARFGATLSLAGLLWIALAFSVFADSDHVVQSGETLTQLATRYGVTVDAIARANNLTVSDYIFPGQKLRIPDGRTTTGTTTTASPAGRSHTVQAGDTLRGLALRYAVGVAELIAANGLTDPDAIRIGQVLRIPGGSTTIPASNATSSSTATGPDTYIVKSGDTLSTIAERYGLNSSQLAALNGISTTAIIRIGQVLRVPGGSGSSQSAATGSSPSGQTATTYVVVAGDTFFGIAQKFGTSVATLLQLNSMKETDIIRIGDRLRVPAGSGTSASPPAAPVATATPRPSATPTPAPTPIPTPRPTGTPPPVSAPSTSGVGDWEPYQITYYCLPGRMANGEGVHVGAAAADASVHPFGTVLEVEGIGRVTIKDRYARDEGRKRLDIWTPNCASALNWGQRVRNVSVVR